MIYLKCGNCGASFELKEETWGQIVKTQGLDNIKIACNSCPHHLPTIIKDALFELV